VKNRIKHIRRTTVVLMLTIATAAFGYYVYELVSGGEGSGSSKLGTIAAGEHEKVEKLPITVTFSQGLKPGQLEPITLEWTNGTGTASDVRKFTAMPSVSEPQAAAGCESSWFKVQGGTGEWGIITSFGEASELIPIPAHGKLVSAGLELVFKETGTNQSACSGATLTIKVVSTS
jgi:hypothetical protein